MKQSGKKSGEKYAKMRGIIEMFPSVKSTKLNDVSLFKAWNLDARQDSTCDFSRRHRNVSNFIA